MLKNNEGKGGTDWWWCQITTEFESQRGSSRLDTKSQQVFMQRVQYSESKGLVFKNNLRVLVLKDKSNKVKRKTKQNKTKQYESINIFERVQVLGHHSYREQKGKKTQDKLQVFQFGILKQKVITYPTRNGCLTKYPMTFLMKKIVNDFGRCGT